MLTPILKARVHLSPAVLVFVIQLDTAGAHGKGTGTCGDQLPCENRIFVIKTKIRMCFSTESFGLLPFLGL